MRTLAILCSGVLVATVVVACTCASPADVKLKAHTPAPGTVADDVPQGTVPLVWVKLEQPSKLGVAQLRIRGNWILRGAGEQTLASGSGLDDRVPLREWDSLLLDGKTYHAPPFVLSPAEPGDLQVGDRRYPGTLRFSTGSDGRMQVQVVTNMETYLEGVVHGEIPAQFPLQSQRAQAVVARTYALATLRDRKDGRLLLSDSGGKDQEFHGIPLTDAAASVAREAVDSTRGLVLLEGRRPLRAWYHSTCGGHTAPAESVFPVVPTAPLSGVVCGHCQASKYYRWESRIPGADVARAAGLPAPLEEFRVLNVTEGGRAVSFLVRARGQSRPVNANRFRLKIGPSLLRSTAIDDVELDGDALVVQGRGWGHGIGLCQMGAKGRAADGDTAEDILAAYYPGARLVRLW